VDETMLVYENDRNCLDQMRRCLADWKAVQSIAENGRRRMNEVYSKARQWALFEAVVAGL
jgi:hypothetical protein